MEQALYYTVLGLTRRYPGSPQKAARAAAAVYKAFKEYGFALDGGAGSGNFEHAGRPGKVGGSAEGKTGGKINKEMENDTDIENISDIISKIDFSKNNILPAISKEDAEMLGVEQKPYLLKQSVGDRNKIRHPDIDEAKAKEILVKALYQRDKILQGTHENKPNYYHFAAFVDKHNYLVLVDFTPEKQYNEIVHYYIMRKRDFIKMAQKIAEQGKKIWE